MPAPTLAQRERILKTHARAAGIHRLDATGSRCRNMGTGKYAKFTLCRVKKAK